MIKKGDEENNNNLKWHVALTWGNIKPKFSHLNYTFLYFSRRIKTISKAPTNPKRNNNNIQRLDMQNSKCEECPRASLLKLQKALEFDEVLCSSLPREQESPRIWQGGPYVRIFQENKNKST